MVLIRVEIMNWMKLAPMNLISRDVELTLDLARLEANPVPGSREWVRAVFHQESSLRVSRCTGNKKTAKDAQVEVRQIGYWWMYWWLCVCVCGVAGLVGMVDGGPSKYTRVISGGSWRTVSSLRFLPLPLLFILVPQFCGSPTMLV